VLLFIGRLPYDLGGAQRLADVPWHDLNSQYKRNYDAAVNHVLEGLRQRGIDAGAIQTEVVRIHRALARLGLERLRTKAQ